MERRIGEKFTVDGKTYIVKESKHCADCAFKWEESCCSSSDFIKDNFGYCSKCNRKDSKNVIFEEIIKMREFNLEEAKAGKPVCTRIGSKVRIFAFDLKNYNRPILGAVECSDGTEAVQQYTVDGLYNSSGETCDFDLMMVTERKQGWINVYKSAAYKDRAVTSGYVYETEEIAKHNITDDDDYIGTVQIEWEE